MSELPLSFPSSPSRYVLHQFGLLRLQGPDRVKYLHSQVTCDVQALQPGMQSLGGHCDPKGKLWSAFRLLVDQDSLWLVMDQSLLARDFAELKKYSLFSKLELSQASGSIPLMGIAGTGTDRWIAEQFGLQDSGLFASGIAAKLETDRWLLLNIFQDLEALPEQPEADWLGFDILAGLPRFTAVAQGEFIPQMLNLQAIQGISFSKGCYMGQETVARAKYRGINQRALFILVGQASTEVQPGMSLERQLGEQWKRTGQVLACWQQAGQVLLTAVLPVDTEADAVLRLHEHADSQLRIRPLPYTLSD